MKKILKNLLLVNHLQYDKRSPNLNLSQKVRRSQDSITSLIYVGVILPSVLWLSTIYFLIMGEVSMNKWVGGSVIVLISLPFYLLTRRKISQIQYHEKMELGTITKREVSRYLFIVILLVLSFFLTMFFCIMLLRRMNFG